MSALTVGSSSDYSTTTLLQKRQEIWWNVHRFQRCAGYNMGLPGVTDLVMCNDGKDMQKDPVWVDDLIREGCDLRAMRSVGDQPINITFGTAVKLVVDWINRSPSCEHNNVRLEYPTPGSSLFADIIIGLSKAETRKSELITTWVPQYKHLKHSAPSDHVNFVLGAIIHMLFDEKEITAYGKSPSHYWVSA